MRQSWSHFTDIRNSVRLNFTYLSSSSTSAGGTSAFGGYRELHVGSAALEVANHERNSACLDYRPRNVRNQVNL